MWSRFSVPESMTCWEGDGEEILFVNPPLMGSGSPKTTQRAAVLTPGSTGLGTEGVGNLLEEAAATSWLWRHDST